MVHTYLLYTILAAASALATPTTRRDGFIGRQDSIGLSSHTGSRIIDEAHPAMSTDIVLPPVAEVFAIMATATSSHPLSSSSTTLSATANFIHLGPGLASSPTTVERIEIAPTISSSENTNPPHDGSPLARKFIFVSVVILSMIAFVLALYAFSYYRYQKRTKMEESPALPEEKEKGRCSVVDITRHFPRSKFSVTSSDYPVSALSSSCESESDCSSDTDSASYRDSYERGLMNPAHFFALRASSMASAHRHSRNGSAPVLGVPRFDAWREQSRRSRSVSGQGEEWL
ncbi:hypothetical protein B0H19DRAFT_1101512 [Mycena capillaripes]|nr:hypothetical protein B0H19DRAFT_1101512 [Mycena capillaripes]